jgi:hypothetical protein
LYIQSTKTTTNQTKENKMIDTIKSIFSIWEYRYWKAMRKAFGDKDTYWYQWPIVCIKRYRGLKRVYKQAEGS